MTRKALTYLGIPAAIVGAFSAVWVSLDFLKIRPVLSRDLEPFLEIVSSNQQGVWLLRWQKLEELRRQRGLSAGERAEYCKLSKLLGFAGVGCA